jgi:hypothetical protein
MEQLCQIYIPAEAGITPARAFYQTGLNGRYQAHIVGISYNDDTQNGDHRFIKLQSNCFRLPYGSYKNAIVFGNKGDHAQGAPGGSYPFELEVMGGGIDIEIIPSTVYDNTGNNKFFFCVLSLIVKPLE